jgi:hypothetical protein
MPTGRSAGVKGTGAHSTEAPQLSCKHRFRYAASGVALVVAFLLCFNVFLLPFPTTVSEAPSGLAMTNLPRGDQATNGNGIPLNGTYVVGPVEEVEGADKDLPKAKLLTMLLLAASFGAAVGRLLTNAQGQVALCSSAVIGPPLATARESLLFLGVFRL